MLLLLLTMGRTSFAQDLKGTIKDKYSGIYLPGVAVSGTSRTAYSDIYGRFILPDVSPGDTITFSLVGYRAHKEFIHGIHAGHLDVYMEQTSILLDAVEVVASRNYTMDSLKLRQEFAEAFNYRKPGFKGVFVPKDYSGAPQPYYQANSSTASLISIDVLSVVSLLGKRQSPQSRLQKVLVKEEDERYVDNMFSKPTVQRLTGLEGESLQTFMQLYRPSADSIRRISEYDVILYIKNSYNEYLNRRK